MIQKLMSDFKVNEAEIPKVLAFLEYAGWDYKEDEIPLHVIHAYRFLFGKVVTKAPNSFYTIEEVLMDKTLLSEYGIEGDNAQYLVYQMLESYSLAMDESIYTYDIIDAINNSVIHPIRGGKDIILID